jgi:chromosomal replication initiator protein
LLNLTSDFVFENFITGPCNRLAHAACTAVAEQPGRAYNPLFIHGGVGLGKTHLLQAICHAIRKNQPDSQMAYISCETFTNHFIEAVERGALQKFRYRYRHADILVIDDIQFLAERERSQEEFFHTFNTLHQSHRQIVLSADCSPSEIPKLEERLVSRFNSGLVTIVDKPCFETRVAIVRAKTRLGCIDLPEKVIEAVAAHVDSNVRELEGALAKLTLLAQTNDGTLPLSQALEALGGSHRTLRRVSISEILQTVSKHYDVRISDLQGKRRTKSIVFPRQVCMYLAREMTHLSLEEIGGYFGGRDHTTVIHAHRLIGKRKTDDPKLVSELEVFRGELGSGN